jgi:hypothetical protein
MAQQASSHSPRKDLVRTSMALNKGDTVKLTMKAAQGVCSATARSRGVEWATRRGVCCQLHEIFAFGVDQVGRSQVDGRLASRSS